MVLGPDALFCGGNPLFHREYHLSSDVHQPGCSERPERKVHKSSVPAMASEVCLGAVRGYREDQEVVDFVYADSDFCGVHPLGGYLAEA